MDIDPSGKHDKTDAQADEMGQTISLTSEGVIERRSTWEPEHEQETSFGGGKTQERRLTDSYVDSLYQKLSDYYDYFRCEGKQLCFRNKDEPLTNQDGLLRMIKQLTKTLSIQRLRDLGFDTHQIMHEYVAALNKVEKELLSTPDVAKADDIELQEIMEDTVRSKDNLIVQLKGESSENLPMHELLGLDKQLRSIRGFLKVEDVKKFQLEECIK